MIWFPVCIDIEDKTILLIGGGKVALQKVQSLIRYTRKMVIVSETILPEIRELGLECHEKSYEASDCERGDILFACTNNRETNERIQKDARRYGKIINVVDTKELCDFIMCAIYKQGRYSIAVSSNGENAGHSAEIRNRIQALDQDGKITQEKTDPDKKDEI